MSALLTRIAVWWTDRQFHKDLEEMEDIAMTYKLMKRIILAGAKRVEITAPVFTVIPESSVGVLGTQTVNYGGLEDD